MTASRPVEASALGSAAPDAEAPAADASRDAPRRRLLALLASRAGLRQALIAGEILAPPLALRDRSD